MQLTDLKTKVNETATCITEQSAGDNDYAVGQEQKTHRKQFNDVVRQSVTSALNEERHKCDVVIGRATESGDDNAFIANVCHKMGFNTKPTGIQRLGKHNNTNTQSKLSHISVLL